MKKQNILKKISLIVLSSIVTISEVLAAADANIRQEKYEIEPRQEQYINDPAYPKLTTKDAGKNPKNKTKKSSGGKFIVTAFATIGVLRTINKTHALISALFGNPYFKIGMMIELSDYYHEDKPLRAALLSPDRDLLHTLRRFKREPILINPKTTQTNNQQEQSNQQTENDLDNFQHHEEDENIQYYDALSPISVTAGESDGTTEIKEKNNKTQTTFPIFKGIVSNMTDDEIETLKKKGKIFAASYPVISKLLLKRFDVLLIDAFDSAAEKISSLFSSKSE